MGTLSNILASPDPTQTQTQTPETSQGTLAKILASPAPSATSSPTASAIPIVAPTGSAGSATAQTSGTGSIGLMPKLQQFGNDIVNATPIGSAKYIYNGLTGQGPMTPLGSGMAAADLASLGLAPLAGAGLKAGEAGAEQLAKSIGTHFAASAAAGAAGNVAGAASGNNPIVTIPASIAAAALTGHAMNPGVAESSVSPLMQKLESLGGQPTAAMRSPSNTANFFDFLARMSPIPWIQNSLQNSDATMKGAIQNLAKQNFGEDALAPSNAETGTMLQNAIQTIKAQRSAAYQPALQALQGISGSGDLKNSLLAAAQSTYPDISNMSANAFQKVLESELAGKETPIQIDKALTGVKNAFQNQLGNMPIQGQVVTDFQKMMGSVNDAYYNGLNKLSSSYDAQGNVIPGTVGDVIREAKGDYADVSQALSPLSKALTLAQTKPEALGKGILNLGTQGIQDLLSQTDPKTADMIQGGLAKSILSNSINAKGDINLGSNLKSYKDIIPLLGQHGENLQELQNAIQQVGMTNMQNINPSGSGHSIGRWAEQSGDILGGLGLLTGHPSALALPAAKMALDSAYSYGGVPIQKLLQSIPSAMTGSFPDAGLATMRQRLNAPQGGISQNALLQTLGN